MKGGLCILMKDKCGHEVILYVDGSYLIHDDVGGWAVYIDYGNNSTTTLSGSVRRSSNNQMELTAIVEGLRALESPSRATIYTDSMYCRNIISKGWIYKWAKNNWMTATWKDKISKPVKNQFILKQLYRLLDKHEVIIIWVKAHADNELNNYVDQVARGKARALVKENN